MKIRPKHATTDIVYNGINEYAHWMSYNNSRFIILNGCNFAAIYYILQYLFNYKN